MKKTITKLIMLAVLVLPVSAALVAQANTDWNVDGEYVLHMNYMGSDYAHNVTLAQDGSDNLTGSGTSTPYAWKITSGTVDGDDIEFWANYTATADAVIPQTVMHVEGTIATDGTISGTWSDNYQGSARAGTFVSASGTAEFVESLEAQDFGVVSYDTGLGMIKGYSAGFGLTGADLGDTESVVVKLYAGDTLLQTNTAIYPAFGDLPGSQFSSPFDVSGSFNYVADGYWTNVREAQYGQSVPATKVVATVTLENGDILTATNLVVAGDPTTIYPADPVDPTPTPSGKDLCKNGGWKTFTDPSFKNQGQCVSGVVKNAKAFR